MKRKQRRLIVPLFVLTASLMFVPITGSAELLPPGDFNGKSLDQWGLDYIQWSLATGLGGESLPDTVDGARYLPPNFGGGDFVASLTIQQGTAVVGAPFFLFGERYDDGSEDNPADPFIDTIFEQTTIRTTFDGGVVLEGLASEFPERKFGVSVFPQPIVYAEPQPRGSISSVAAIFGVGIVTIFDMLPPGEHTIKNEFDSSVFGKSSFTYNVQVVPEPSSLCCLGASVLSLLVARGRVRWARSRGSRA